METNEKQITSISRTKILDHLSYDYEMPLDEMIAVAKTKDPIFLEKLCKKRFLPIEVKKAICEYGTPFNCLQIIDRGGVQHELYQLIAFKCISYIKTNSKGYKHHLNAEIISPSLVNSIIKDANAILKNVCVTDLHGEDLTEIKHLLRKIGISNDIYLLQKVLEEADFKLLYLLRLLRFSYIDYEQAFAINCLKRFGNIIWADIEVQKYSVRSNNDAIVNLMLEHMPLSSLPHEVALDIFKYCGHRIVELILSKKWIGYSAEMELINANDITAINRLLKYAIRMSDDAKKAIKKHNKTEWNQLLKSRFNYA